MNCEILSTLYSRSNGDIPCDDDAGEKILLDTALRHDWSLIATFSNAAYRHIRQSLEAGRVPWPDTCPSCAFYRPNHPFTDSISRLEIHKLQIEPSLVCNLRCPCCSQLEQITHRPKPFLMTSQLFEKILREIRRANFLLREIEYCGQGDPLMNREFPAFVRLARNYFPTTRQRLITNGNFDYARATALEAIDEIFVSCDGVSQHSYEQYRILGDLTRVLNFMRAIPKVLNGKPQLVVWKYILFEFNDSDEEIREAQLSAQELGVDLMLFVITQSKFRSQRFTASNIADFPVYFPNVRINATLRHYQQSPPPLRPKMPWLWPAVHRKSGTLFMIDEVTLVSRNRLSVRGWLLSKDNIDGILVRVNKRIVGLAEANRPRPDVYHAFPQYGELNSEYLIAVSLSEDLSNEVEIAAELMDGKRSVAVFSRKYLI